MEELSGYGSGYGMGYFTFNTEPVGWKVVKDPDDDTIERFECTACPRDRKGKPQCRVQAENCVLAYKEELDREKEKNGGKTKSLEPIHVEKLVFYSQLIIHAILQNKRFSTFAPFDVSFGWGPSGKDARGIVISFHNEGERLILDHAKWQNPGVDRPGFESDRRTRYMTPLLAASINLSAMIEAASKGLSSHWSLPSRFDFIATIKNAQEILAAAAKEYEDASAESSDLKKRYDPPIVETVSERENPQVIRQNEQQTEQPEWLQDSPEPDPEEEEDLDEDEKEERRKKREKRKALKENMKRDLQPGFALAEIEEHTNLLLQMNIGTFEKDGDGLRVVPTKVKEEDKKEQVRLQ